MSIQLNAFDSSISIGQRNTVVNVASVPQRSPFRYPGGKTWLIPQVRNWLKYNRKKTKLLVEPFAGGGIVSLTAAFEDLAERVLMIELDEEISAVWKTIIGGDARWLAEKIFNFDLTSENARNAIEKPNKSLKDIAFSTILKNRIYHGGIIAKGSGMLKHGENGKGITSRWYPKTLHDRIIAIDSVKDKLAFLTDDAFNVLKKYENRKNISFFIDPPYTVAGKRLYNIYDLDHEKLFYQTSKLKGSFMLTYDDTNDIRKLATKYKLNFKTVPMKTTHHLTKSEIIVSDDFSWLHSVTHN